MVLARPGMRDWLYAPDVAQARHWFSRFTALASTSDNGGPAFGHAADVIHRHRLDRDGDGAAHRHDGVGICGGVGVDRRVWIDRRDVGIEQQFVLPAARRRFAVGIVDLLQPEIERFFARAANPGEAGIGTFTRCAVASQELFHDPHS